MPFRRIRTLFFLGTFIFSLSLLAADSNHEAFTDAESAGKDFQVQGEYEGTADDDDNYKIAAQVIALGNGEFDVVGFVGGLPGDGWSRGDETHHARGKWDGDHVAGHGTGEDDGTRIEIKDGVLKVFDPDGKCLATFKKVERKSPTLGAKPPADAVVLFDGSGTDAFEDGKLVDDKYLGASNCYSKKMLGDHTLHLEFRTPFMPTAREQGRGNSGVYVQGRYEVQVLDSFGLDGKSNECGGIYSVGEPNVNMCYPPLAWQTYDIDFTSAVYDDSGKKTKNARITVRHNGVVIHDDIELGHDTPGRHRENPEPEALFLQNHGNPVVFQNIWVVEK